LSAPPWETPTNPQYRTPAFSERKEWKKFRESPAIDLPFSPLPPTKCFSRSGAAKKIREKNGVKNSFRPLVKICKVATRSPWPCFCCCWYVPLKNKNGKWVSPNIYIYMYACAPVTITTRTMAVTTRTILYELRKREIVWGGMGFPVYFSCWGNFFRRRRFLYALRSNNVIS